MKVYQVMQRFIEDDEEDNSIFPEVIDTFDTKEKANKCIEKLFKVYKSNHNYSESEARYFFEFDFEIWVEEIKVK